MTDKPRKPTAPPADPASNPANLPVPVSTEAGAMAFSHRGIKILDVEALYRYATMAKLSELAPSGLDSVAKIAIAIETGVELGLPIQAALRSVYVVGKTPALKGDAAKAIVFNSGLLEAFDEKVEGEGDDRGAVVAVKRKGMPNVIERTFSIANAKLAGLVPPDWPDPVKGSFPKHWDSEKLGKWRRSGWAKYPDRMLKYRALGFALRDVFPDVLLGVAIREEVETPFDVTSIPVAARRAPEAPDPLLRTLTVAPADPGADASTDASDPESVDPGAAQASEATTAPPPLAFVEIDDVECPLCSATHSYEVALEGHDAEKDIGVPCTGCGAEFPVENPRFDPEALKASEAALAAEVEALRRLDASGDDDDPDPVEDEKPAPSASPRRRKRRPATS